MKALILLLFMCCSISAAPMERSWQVPYPGGPESTVNQLHRTLFIFTLEKIDTTHRFQPLDPETSIIRDFSGRKPDWQTHDGHFDHVHNALQAFVNDKDALAELSVVERLLLQRDLWAVFDQLAWMPTNWVHYERDEPRAQQLRTVLAQTIIHLALSQEEIAQLPDTYQATVDAGVVPANLDRPKAGYLPPDMFNQDRGWVRLSHFPPLAEMHTRDAKTRAHFHILIRLPEGRKPTLEFLEAFYKLPKEKLLPKIPEGTQVALIRRALAIDQQGKIRETPLIEKVQMRVYRTVEGDPENRHRVDPESQYTFALDLDRPALLNGYAGLVPELPPGAPDAMNLVRLDGVKTVVTNTSLCLGCHAGPGVHSINSLRIARNRNASFYPYDYDVEIMSTMKHKYRSYEWGLLQGYWEQLR